MPVDAVEVELEKLGRAELAPGDPLRLLEGRECQDFVHVRSVGPEKRSSTPAVGGPNASVPAVCGPAHRWVRRRATDRRTAVVSPSVNSVTNRQSRLDKESTDVDFGAMRIVAWPRASATAGLVVAASLAVLGGCAVDQKPDPIELGIGRFDAATGTFEFIELDQVESVPYVAGVQGGYHVWVMLGLHDRPDGDFSSEVTLLDADGESVGSAQVEWSAADVVAPSEAHGLYCTPPVAVVLDLSRFEEGAPVEVVGAVEGAVSGSAAVETVFASEDAAGLAQPDVRLEDVEPLSIERPDEPYFEPQPVASSGGDCLALVDVGDGGSLELLWTDGSELNLGRLGGDRAWEIERTPIEGELSEVACQFMDFDGDGHGDLVLVGAQSGTLLFGDGAGGFEEVPESVPQLSSTYDGDVLPAAWPDLHGLAAADFDNDGLPDLYLLRSKSGAPTLFEQDGCTFDDDGGGICGVDGGVYPGMPNAVLHNVGGRFEWVEGTGAEDVGQAICVGVWDVDRDGALDAMVCNDADRTPVYLGDGRLGFDEVGESLGLDERNHGMGLAVADFDQDGVDDIYIADMGRPYLLRGDGDGRFEPAPAWWNIGYADHWTWGAEAEDIDNDGDWDLVVAGHPTPQFTMQDGTRSSGPYAVFDDLEDAPAVMIHRNLGAGVFVTEEVPGIDAGGGRSPGLVVRDIDRDGRVDAVVTMKRDTGREVVVLWGTGETEEHWVAVDAPIGALVEACTAERCTHRHVVGGGSYRASRGTRARFGLGESDTATVRVEWPAGTWHELGELQAGRSYRWRPER